MLATWAVQTVDGCTKYHCKTASDTLPPFHKLTHTVMAAEDGTLHIEVLGRVLSKDTAPSLSVLDGLPHNTTLKRKVSLIAKLKVALETQDTLFLIWQTKEATFTSKGSLLQK